MILHLHYIDGKISKVRGRRKPNDRRLTCMTSTKGDTLFMITTVIVTSFKFFFGRSGC